MKLELRSKVMHTKDPKILYLARNLICDKATVYDTGFAPFSTENIDKDFKITIRIKSFDSSNANNDVVLGCKYEGTISDQQWPGIYIRKQNSTFNVGGYNYWTPAINSVLGNNLYIWRESGIWYAQLDGGTQQTLSVRVANFDQNIIIGAGQQTNGSYFRYSKGVIDYVRIEYLNVEDEVM